MKTYKKLFILASVLLVLLQAVPAMAQSESSAKKGAAVALSTVIARADKEIDQRIKNLNELSLRISSMKKLSESQKSALTGQVQQQIADLNALKAKIDADTDLQTARNDAQGIAKSYRIYLLIMPQIKLSAAADRALAVADSLKAISTKLQSRISTLPSDKQESANKLVLDMNAKIDSAVKLANEAIAEISALKPDNGDKAILQENAKALKDASSKIKSATSDLKTARQDTGSIAKLFKTASLEK